MLLSVYVRRSMAVNVPHWENCLTQTVVSWKGHATNNQEGVQMRHILFHISKKVHNMVSDQHDFFVLLRNPNRVGAVLKTTHDPRMFPWSGNDEWLTDRLNEWMNEWMEGGKEGTGFLYDRPWIKPLSNGLYIAIHALAFQLSCRVIH